MQTAYFSAVTMVDCVQQTTVVGGGNPEDLPKLQWMNTELGSLKTSLSKIYRTTSYVN